MKKTLLTMAIAVVGYCSYAQDATFNNLIINSLTKGAGAGNVYGWGYAYDNTLDPRPNYSINAVPFMINNHTGLTFSAHSYYGGIRFYNQGYPNAYDPATGSVMAMSITNGSVGIANTAPNQKLDVAGNVLVRGAGNYAYNNPGSGELHIGYGLAAPGTIGSVTRLAIQPYGHTGGPWKFDARDASSTAYLDIYYGGAGVGTGLTLDNSGNVGIGTIEAHGYKLAVNGNVMATSMTVKLYADWPDYVFKRTYKLPSLSGNYI